MQLATTAGLATTRSLGRIHGNWASSNGWDADRKGFDIKQHMKWFHVGSTVDDDGHHGVKAHRASDIFLAQSLQA